MTVSVVHDVSMPERAGKPSFVGMTRGEIFKLLHFKLTWILLFLLLGIICLPYIGIALTPQTANMLTFDPYAFLYQQMNGVLSVLRVFSGIVLIMLTARVMGLDYQYGTVRVLLSRGVGRMQLLSAKLAAMFLIASVILVSGLVVNYVLSLLLISSLPGGQSALNGLDSAFWIDTRIYIFTVALSMLATILMVTAAAVLGKSYAAGLAIGLGFFAVDNIGVGLLFLINQLTQNSFWLKLTTWLLGPNLNAMPTQLLAGHTITINRPYGPPKVTLQAFSFGATPLDPVDGGHTLMVAALYIVFFLAVAYVLMARRDVQE